MRISLYIFLLGSFLSANSVLAQDVEMGMSRSEVVKLLGRPKGEMSYGNNRSLVYEKGNIDFVDEKVTRVEWMSDEQYQEHLAYREQRKEKAKIERAKQREYELKRQQHLAEQRQQQIKIKAQRERAANTARNLARQQQEFKQELEERKRAYAKKKSDRRRMEYVNQIKSIKAQKFYRSASTARSSVQPSSILAPSVDLYEPISSFSPSYSSESAVREPIESSSIAALSANRFDPNSLANPYGAGSPYKSDGLMNPYSRYGSKYSNQSWNNPYATDAPKLYDSDGKYLGKLSANKYDPDSTSNPYGRYGSKYSPESINNPYGAGNPYSTDPIYVVPSP